ncbi:urease accessory protein [Pseudomonas duriflava]|uniref:Urease accessory protein n=1 Tax=Pseudomonas duriflava TaxID=459528 RepID=A0A562Q2T0_9PSED|nr:HupE/UreJ family protein [Pseudomonas duriflava]TWI50991.1 urease accessory protein [Pseudomonas duriflava]
MRLTHRALFLTAGLLASTSALAHPGHEVSGLASGILHPLTGLDHLLAMLGVGLWAGQRGGKSIWMIPLAFMAMMLAGGLLGMEGVALPGVELGIAVSVTLFGLLIAFGVRLPVWVGMLLVGGFALFHGHAHGEEMPATAGALSFAFGFTLATGALHATGVGASWLSRNLPRLVRLAGAAISVAGAAMLAIV